MVIGTIWGMAAAFLRGWLDEVLMRLADTVMAIPQMLFALVFISAFGATPVKLALIIGVLLTPTTARLVRSSVLGEIQADYFTAAVSYGASKGRLLTREVLPNVAGPITVQAAINAANALLLEASMSFVGLGIQPPEATWGTLVQQGYQKMYQSTGYVLFPALFIFITIWMLNLLADQLGETAQSKGRK
nr:ABC transporter permease [Leucobacter chromiireducens]